MVSMDYTPGRTTVANVGESVTDFFLPNWKGATAALVVGATFVALTVLSPRRVYLAFLLSLGFAIALSGMLKYRRVAAFIDGAWQSALFLRLEVCSSFLLF